MVKFILKILLVLLSVQLFAQNGESQPNSSKPADAAVPKHSPRKATILSMVLPGAGQVYNRKNWWWKVPVIYAAGGSLLYGAIYYQNGYNDYRNAYIERLQTQTNKDPQYNRFQTPTLQVIRDSYRDARDQTYIWLVLVYTLQILDAAVEAHFYEFNMNENISLNLQPAVLYSGNEYASGLKVTFNLR